MKRLNELLGFKPKEKILIKLNQEAGVYKLMGHEGTKKDICREVQRYLQEYAINHYKEYYEYFVRKRGSE